MNIQDMVNDFGEALEPKNIRLSKSQKATQEWFDKLVLSTPVLPDVYKEMSNTIPVTSKFVQAINMLICNLQQFSYNNNIFVTLTSNKLIDFFEYIYTIPDYILPEAVIYSFIQNNVDRCVDLFFIETTPDARFGYNPTSIYFNPKYKDLVYETNRVIHRELRCKSINLNNFTISVDGETIYRWGEQ